MQKFKFERTNQKIERLTVHKTFGFGVATIETW